MRQVKTKETGQYGGRWEDHVRNREKEKKRYGSFCVRTGWDAQRQATRMTYVISAGRAGKVDDGRRWRKRYGVGYTVLQRRNEGTHAGRRGNGVLVP